MSKSTKKRLILLLGAAFLIILMDNLTLNIQTEREQI